MLDNESESDSLECAGSGPGGQLGSSSAHFGSTGTSKRFKRLQVIETGQEAAGETRLLGGGPNCGPPVHYQCGADLNCQHQTGPAGGHLGAELAAGGQPFGTSLYANGYNSASYYNNGELVYCSGQFPPDHRQQLAEHQTGVHEPKSQLDTNGQPQAPNGDHHLWHHGGGLASGGELEAGDNLLAADPVQLTGYLASGDPVALLDEYWAQAEVQQRAEKAAQSAGDSGEPGGLDNTHNQEEHRWQAAGTAEAQFSLFEQQYKEFYRQLVDHLGQLNFASAEECLRHFWQAGNSCQTTDHWTGESSRETQEMGGQSVANNGGGVAAPKGTLEVGFLRQIVGQQQCVGRIICIDRQMYSMIQSHLMPSLFNPIPRLLTQMLKSFALNFPNWLEASLKDYPQEFQLQSCKLAREFGHTLRQLISINRLASASRAIWSRRSALAQMSNDLNRIDLRDIEHQVSLMVRQQIRQQQQSHALLNADNSLYEEKNDDNTQSSDGARINGGQQASMGEHEIFHQAQQPMSTAHTNKIDNNNENCHYQLGSPHPLGHNNMAASLDNGPTKNSNHQINLNSQTTSHHEHSSSSLLLQPTQLVQSILNLINDTDPASQWPNWCLRLVDGGIDGGKSLDEARNFVLRWNFYISLIVKELTLRSAPSLGSFQLIRLLLDEYIYHLVVSKFSQFPNKGAAQLLDQSYSANG